MKWFRINTQAQPKAAMPNESNQGVSKGDVFIKNDKVPSTFVVDRVLDFSPAPMHVRLKEIGGNERSVTVALDILTDTHFWHRPTA